MNKRLFMASAFLVFAGCGGGSTSMTPQLPSSVTQAVNYSTASSTVTLPKILNDITASVTIPAGTTATTGTLTYETSVPAGVAAPASTVRAPASIGGTSLKSLGVLALTVSASVSFTTTPGFEFTFAQAPSGSTYVAFYDASNPANGWNVISSVGVVDGKSVTFAPQPLTPPLTFVAGDTYYFALVESSAAITPSATTASYTGTKTINDVYGYAFGYPQPSPNVTAPPVTTSYSVATAVSIGSSPYPGPSPATALTDEHVAETDTGSLSNATFTTDSYVGQTVADGTDTLSLYATVAGEPTSQELPKYTTLFATPQKLDQYPESAASWTTNSPAAAISYSFADGDAGTRTVNADGTYVDVEQLANTTTNTVTLTENSDGSGSITGPYYGGDIIASITFSAPSGGNVTSTFTYTPDAQQNYGYPPTSSVQDPTWYTIPPFYAETDTVTPNASLPATCSSTYGTTATHVNRTITSLDTVIGDIETTTLDSYAIGGVPVCLLSNDVVNYAYDEEANTPYLLYVGQLGTEIVTTNETLNLQPGATSALPAAKNRSAAAIVPGSSTSAAFAALENHELAAFAKARVVHEHTFLTSLRSRRAASFKAALGGAR